MTFIHTMIGVLPFLNRGCRTNLKRQPLFALKRKLGIDPKLVLGLGYSLLVAENVFLKENYNGQKCHISQNVRTVLLLSR